MIRILSNIFIKNPNDITSPEVRRSYGVLCGGVGIFLNILLFAGKFFAGLLSHSIAITADAFNNLSDAGSSLITLIGFKMAGQKPDKDHPFGHGRIEYISGLFVSIAILLMAYELIQTSIQKIKNPSELALSPLILIILIISISVKLYMYFYNHQIGKQINSSAMFATATDSLSDCLATGVVLIASMFNMITGINIDGYCGIAVGLFIFYAGIASAKETISPLLGQPPEKEFIEQIKKIVMSSPYILGIHDLIVHNYGPGRMMISLHAEVSASGDFIQLHDEIDNIEQTLRKELLCDAVIHMDPIVTNDKETNLLKEHMKNILNQLDPSLTMHDFRIVKGPTHTNLIFDIVLPPQYTMTDQEVLDSLTTSIKEISPKYFAVIHIDRAYC